MTAPINSAIKQYRRGQPSKWVIIFIILGIIVFAIIFVAICVLIRVNPLGRKNKTTDS